MGPRGEARLVRSAVSAQAFSRRGRFAGIGVTKIRSASLAASPGTSQLKIVLSFWKIKTRTFVLFLMETSCWNMDSS
jgi:hypothetical protein